MNNSPTDPAILLANESFQRWLSNTSTKDEVKHWESWLKENPNHPEIYQEAVRLWQMATFRPVTTPDVEIEWNRLQRRLHQFEKNHVSERNSFI